MKHEAILIKIIILFLFVGLYFMTNLRTKQNHNYTFLSESDAQKFKIELSVENVWKRSENCLNYFQSLGGIIFPNETLENQKIKIANYLDPKRYSEPKEKLAVSFLVHQSPGLFEILFHLMFRPQNVYCIVIDPKVHKSLRRTFRAMLKCYRESFPESKILIANVNFPIEYYGYSILNADLTCLELMYNSSQ